jgi:hypothetical protein
MDTSVGSGLDGMHGDIWYWTVIGILIVAVLVFVAKLLLKK